MLVKLQKPLWLLIILCLLTNLSIYADAPNPTTQPTQRELRLQKRLEKRRARKRRRQQRKLKRVNRVLKSRLGKWLLKRAVREASNRKRNIVLIIGLVFILIGGLMYISLLASTGIFIELILALNTAVFLVTGLIMLIISFALKGSKSTKKRKGHSREN